MNDIVFSEKRFNWSVLTGIVLILGIVVWMSSGGSEEISQNDVNSNEQSISLNKVQTKIFPVQELPIDYTFYGNTKFSDKTNIFPLEDGTIANIFVTKGDLVSVGDTIFEIDIENLENEFISIEKEIENTLNELARTKKLIEKGLSPKNKIEAIEEKYTKLLEKEKKLYFKQEKQLIKSNISGIIGELNLVEGEFISKNQILTSVININPIIVEIEVPQDKILKINKDNTVTISPLNGNSYSGKITYISPEANNDTRAFKVEIEVPNDNNIIPSGVSAKANILTDITEGHFIPLSTLVLSENGDIGIKQIVDSTAIFTPVKMIKTDLDGAWIQKISNTLEVITVGQGYVLNNEKVETYVSSNNE